MNNKTFIPKYMDILYLDPFVSLFFCDGFPDEEKE